MSLEQNLDQCFRGNHKLEVIYEAVKWCRICGCVMIDIKTGGRTISIITKSPKIFRRA